MFPRGKFGHVTRPKRSCASENICRIVKQDDSITSTNHLSSVSGLICLLYFCSKAGSPLNAAIKRLAEVSSSFE